MNNSGNFLRLFLAVAVSALLSGCGLAHRLTPASEMASDERYRQWFRPGAASTPAERLAAVGNQDAVADAPLKLNGALTLKDAVRLAVAYNRDLRSTVELRAIAAGIDLEAFAGTLPTVQASAGYTRLGERNRLEFAGNTLDLGAQDNYSVALRLQQPIYRGGAVTAAMRIAQLNRLIADRTIQDHLQDLVLRVTETYHEVLLEQQLVAAEHDAVQSAKLFYDDIVKKRTQGLATEYDQLRAEVELANLEATERERSNALQLQYVALLGLMDASFDSQVALADRLEHQPFAMTLPQAVAAAFEHRPDLQSGRLQIASIDAEVDADLARYHPQVDFYAQQTWGKPDPVNLSSSAWNDRWEAGLQLQWTLFDGLAREGRIRRDRARLKQRQLQQAAREQQLIVEIRQAFLGLQNAEAMLTAQKLNLERATLAQKLATEGVQRGTCTALDLSESRTAVTRARTFYQRALFQHVIAKAHLQHAMGLLQ